MAAASRVLGKLAIVLSGPTYYILNYISCGIGLRESVRSAEGITGRRPESSSRERQGPRQVAGPLNLFVTPTDLDQILPWIMGGAKSGSNFPLTNYPPTFTLLHYKDSTGGFFEWSGCVVNTATFSATTGGFLNVNLDVMGNDETQPTGITLNSYPDVKSPYVMEDCVLLVNTTAYPFDSFSCTIAQNQDAKFFNNLTPQRYVPGIRKTTVNLSMPLGDTAALYGIAVASATVVATFTNGSDSLTITLNNVSSPRSAIGENANEFEQNWVGTATETVASNGTTITPEVIIANVST